MPKICDFNIHSTNLKMVHPKVIKTSNFSIKIKQFKAKKVQVLYIYFIHPIDVKLKTNFKVLQQLN